MHSAASCEARLFVELWRIPFQLPGQEPILTCASKVVKEAGRTRESTKETLESLRAVTFILPHAASLRYSSLEGAHGRSYRLRTV